MTYQPAESRAILNYQENNVLHVSLLCGFGIPISVAVGGHGEIRDGEILEANKTTNHE